VESPAVRETHVSILLFLGDRVFKLRKPLRFDFADFSTRSARAEDCRREVDLNRRLAPDVYLGVAEVTLEGEALEHCVVMRRLPAERSLAHLVREPESLWSVELRRVARTLAEFHARADRSPSISGAASIEAVTRQFEANVAAMAPFVGPVLDPAAHGAVVRGVRRFLEGRSALFAGRIAAGQICDGHGDLQADDIYCLDDGPRILDCLEFDDLLRCGDVVADVAFLAMDLERLGARAAAERFVHDYEGLSGAPLPPSLLHFYVALRAYIRAKVACLRHEQGDSLGAREAPLLLALAGDHLERARVRLVVVGGLPGSGKSTLASALGAELGAIVLRSDELRPEQFGAEHGPTTSGYRRGRYTDERTHDVYEHLMGAARVHLGLGESVILDASWIASSHRDEARHLAAESAAELTELRCTVPADVAEQRIAARLRVAADPSEATVGVRRAMARIEAPWTSATVIETARAPGLVLADALAVIGARVERG